MKRLLLALGLACLAVTLALVASAQLPDRALPVVLGVIAGVAAGLPISLVIIVGVRWAQQRPAVARAPAAPARPRTIIVVPEAAPGPTPRSPAPVPPASAPAPLPPSAALVHETRPAAIIGGADDSAG